MQRNGGLVHFKYLEFAMFYENYKHKDMELADIKELKPRDVWPNEATDFTPWLAKEKSLALLGNTISMDLELFSLK